jgi:hypothetical protein
MRTLVLQIAVCLLLAGGTAFAQRGGGHGGGMGGGGFHGGGGMGGFRGGGMGGFRGGFGGGGFRGGFGGFHGGFNRGFHRGFNRFNRFNNGFFGAGIWPFYGGYAYAPYYGYPYSYGYDYYGYPNYGYPVYNYSYPGYNSSPNVTIIYPPTASSAYAQQPAHPVIREYDQYGQEISPTTPSGGVASGDNTSSASPIYLFGFKGNVIGAASWYWVTGSTLHYITPQHEERRVPLADVDRTLTNRLNAERHVTVQLP